MKKIIWVGLVVIFAIAIIYIIQITNEQNPLELNTIQKTVHNIDNVTVPNNSLLFMVRGSPDDYVGKDQTGQDSFTRYLLSPKKENQQLYDSLGPKNVNQTTVVVIPIFTMLAYSDHGFYDYYAGKCDEKCLTVDATVVASKLKTDYRSSAMANQVFQILGYDRISDADVNNDPSILAKYDRVILLHNEYVTKNMFDAITNHPKVIYLYPNALHAEILADDITSSIKLIRGHGYPEKNITNGFDWKYDNTNPYEFDAKCNNWNFYKISNGFMLNCYPENIIFTDEKFLQTLLNL